MPDAQTEDALHHYMHKFEALLDLERARRARETCHRALCFQPVEELPYVLSDTSAWLPTARCAATAPDTDWPSYPYNDTFVDPAKMLLDQLRAPFLHHQLGDYHPLNIRCNYGTVILPSVFGAGYQLTETSLPWAHHLGGRDEVRALIDRGVPDTHHGLGGTCFQTAAYYREVLSAYPRLREAITLYHPDLQGPFDVAHLIWGPDILYALYDCPDLVHALLALVTETYRVWMREWKAFVGEGNEFTTQWNFYIRGGIMLRDDTPVMLSAGHYEEFVKPYDQALLDEFGGCIHFCGRGDAFISSMGECEHLYGIHSSQPDLNDVDLLLRSTVDRGIALLGFPQHYLTATGAGHRTGIIVLR